MKLFTIAAALLLSSIHSSEAAAPKLRANLKNGASTAEVEMVESKSAATATQVTYESFGPGYCLDAGENYYPNFAFTGEFKLSDCSGKCGCALDVKGVELRGFTFGSYDPGVGQPLSGRCVCFVDKLSDQTVIATLEERCSILSYGEGSGEVTHYNNSTGTCYRKKLGGGNSEGKNEASTAAEVEEVAESKGKTVTAAAADSSRERISQFVKDGQMFYVFKDQTIVFEDPSKDPVTVSAVFWMCQPTVAPDLNGDGMYDSVVSHANFYVPPATLTSTNGAGANGMVGNFMTEGYTASWVKQGKYYNELFVDFGDFTVWQVNGKEFMGYETSAPGTTGGMVSSGEGLWTTDLSHPLLQKMAKDLGTDLTPEACADRYAQTWNEEHSGSTEVRKKLW